MYKKGQFKFINVFECEDLLKIKIGRSTIPVMSKEYATYTFTLLSFDRSNNNIVIY